MSELAAPPGGEPRVVECPKGNRFELRSIECPICGPGGQELLGMRGGAHQRWGLGVATRIVRCRRCGLVFPNPFPRAVDPQRLYGDPASYFEGFAVDDKIQGSRVIIRQLLDRTGPDPRVLDVGAGRGEFLRAAQLEGVRDVLGLELSTAMAQAAREQFGIDIAMATVEDFAATKPKPFDFVALNAVLEHVYDPNAFIAAVAAVTAPGGWVYVDVPAEPNLLTMLGNTAMRLTGRRSVLNLQPTWPPFHVFGFSPRTLRILLEKHGYEVASVVVWAGPHVRRRPGDPVDAVRSFVATQVNRLANLTGLASNMYVWARKRPVVTA